MLNRLSGLQYPKSKLIILSLLTLNALLYLLVDTLISALDAITWLILLVLYELEANEVRLPLSTFQLQQVRNGLIAVIVFVFFSYLFEGDWLDVLNTLLWFALVVMLELEMRRPEWASEHARLMTLSTASIFIGLIGVAVLWGWQQAWLDAYDAALWIAAFGFIEVDMFQWLQRAKLTR